VDPVSSGRAVLTIEPGENADFHEIHRSTVSSSFTAEESMKIAKIGANPDSYPSTGLQPLTQYHYRVVAVSGDDRAVSAAVSATTPAVENAAPFMDVDFNSEDWPTPEAFYIAPGDYYVFYGPEGDNLEALAKRITVV
jgi:hypothetical protein